MNAEQVAAAAGMVTTTHAMITADGQTVAVNYDPATGQYVTPDGQVRILYFTNNCESLVERFYSLYYHKILEFSTRLPSWFHFTKKILKSAVFWVKPI